MNATVAVSSEPSPFHAGELRAQTLAGGGSGGAGIRGFMPDQHRLFFTQLPLVLVGVAGEDGWPIATVLTGAPGFMNSPDPTHLRIAALPGPDDPAFGLLRPGRRIGLLGLEFPTRRRNRANGIVSSQDAGGFTVEIDESFGNCAKYIQTREVRAVSRPVGPVERMDALDTPAVDLIRSADTFFVASRAGSGAGSLDGRLDVSHRGGRPGFVQVRGRELVIPDFKGNRYYNTFGNLLEDERASLLFVDFEGGTILHLGGTASVEWSARGAPEGAERLWRFSVLKATRRSGLPLGFDFQDYAPTTLETGIW